MSHLNSLPKLRRPLPASADFARFQLTDKLMESICLNCYSVLGTSSHLRGLEILEKSHRCRKAGKDAA